MTRRERLGLRILVALVFVLLALAIAKASESHPTTAHYRFVVRAAE